LDQVPLTETMKIKTQVLAQDGFTAANYWLDPVSKAYVPLDEPAVERIRAGLARL